MMDQDVSPERWIDYQPVAWENPAMQVKRLSA
jgi:hypothetical protein